MNKTALIVIATVIVVVSIAAGIALSIGGVAVANRVLDSLKPAPKPYAGGALIDANEETGILYEEDGDPAELANRLVALANGGSFTQEQIDQITTLTAGMFEELRGMGMDIEYLQWQVKRLEAAQQQPKD